jgi:hypothetical protein
MNNGPDIAYDKQATFAVICNIYSLTVSNVYLYNKENKMATILLLNTVDYFAVLLRWMG